MQFHKTFKRLKQYDSITLRVGPHEVSTLSMTRLVKNHRHLGLKLQQREIHRESLKGIMGGGWLFGWWVLND